MTTSQVITATTCPFESSVGYTTENGRVQYLMVEHGVSEQDAKGISKSLDADMDPSKPLYFWQLYSLIGHEPIISIVQNFYERVYGDEEEPWPLMKLVESTIMSRLKPCIGLMPLVVVKCTMVATTDSIFITMEMRLTS